MVPAFFFSPSPWMLCRHHSCCDSHLTVSNECGAAEVGLAQMVEEKAGTPPMQMLTTPGPFCLSSIGCQGFSSFSLGVYDTDRLGHCFFLRFCLLCLIIFLLHEYEKYIYKIHIEWL